MPVVAQVSDLHLSPRVPARQVQAELVIAGINQAKPDLTVVTGDLTDDGWDRPEDLVWAKDWMDERLDSEWFAVPGNHDVGNFAGAEHGAITAERLRAWQDTFCGRFSDWFWKTLGPWELVGLNSMVYGSSETIGRLQWERCHGQLPFAKWEGRHLAVFLHSPFFVNAIDEPETDTSAYWLGDRSARQEMWADINTPGLRLIGSGHVHQTRMADIGAEKGVGSLFHTDDPAAPTPPQEKDSRPLFRGNTRIVWAPPASGTWVHAPGLPNPPAPERTGFVLHHLGDDGSVRSEVVECAPMLKTVTFDPTAQGDG
ncbi:MAG: metallophosphoesterase family protein [Phycisphaerales bacterium JB063]